MSNARQYDLIQSQGHEGLKVAKTAYLKGYLCRRYACNQGTNGEL